MNIRRVRYSDIDAFVKLYVESYEGLEEYAYTNEDDVKQYFRWLLSRDPEGFFVVELEEPVGFIACDANWFSHFDGEFLGEIHEIFVHPKRRGCGIGSLLIKKAMEYVECKGRRTIGLWVSKENLYAKEFYKRMGFIETISVGKWTRMIKRF